MGEWSIGYVFLKYVFIVQRNTLVYLQMNKEKGPEGCTRRGERAGWGGNEAGAARAGGLDWGENRGWAADGGLRNTFPSLGCLSPCFEKRSGA